jgi:FSR family fosmidomycin resistance protein-like MFS transporter
MARWTLAGSVGVVAGPVLLGVALWSGLGWRALFLALAGLMLALALVTGREPYLRRRPPAQVGEDEPAPGVRAGLRRAWLALRRPAVLRWLILLDLSDLVLDVLLGFLALYLVDVAGVSPAAAGAALAIRSVAGLAGDALVIPVLDRVSGVSYVRWSAAVVGALFAGFLLAPWYPVKLVLLALMSAGTAGWYAVLQGRFYGAMPGQSGTAMAAGSAFGLITGLTPLALGWVAERFGLPVTMWLLLLGPLALLVGLPRQTAPEAPVDK